MEVNMTTQNNRIECPQCGTQIEIAEILTKTIEVELRRKITLDQADKIKAAENNARMETSQQFSDQIKELQALLNEKAKNLQEAEEREKEIKEKEKALETKAEQLDDEVLRKVKEEKLAITEKIREQIKNENKLELDDIKSQLESKNKKLEEAQRLELELRTKSRELEEEKKDFELHKQRELDASRQEIEQKAKNDAATEYKLQIRERDEKLRRMSEQIENLKKKTEQGSPQLQGEAQELELEDFLRSNFPLDDIIEVKKGQKGADIIQKVKNEFGVECGTILWESKRTQSFDKKWILKLKDDQRDVKANVAVIISQILPENIVNFGLEDGIWVGSYQSTLGIATALRNKLIEIFNLRQSEVGKNQKMDALYGYLTSHEFAHRIEAIIEAFNLMKEQITSERRAFEKQWSAREQMLNQVLKSTSGLHGDLKGLMGASLPEIESLSMDRILLQEN